jgi:hypothetical protein
MLYIVHIAIDNDRNDEWFRWMRDVHIRDVIDTGCFSDATVVRDFDADTGERTAYRIFYRAYSERSFDRYQREHASALQAEHTERYQGCFDADRELLPIVNRMSADPRTGEEE